MAATVGLKVLLRLDVRLGVVALVDAVCLLLRVRLATLSDSTDELTGVESGVAGIGIGTGTSERLGRRFDTGTGMLGTGSGRLGTGSGRLGTGSGNLGKGSERLRAGTSERFGTGSDTGSGMLGARAGGTGSTGHWMTLQLVISLARPSQPFDRHLSRNAETKGVTSSGPGTGASVGAHEQVPSSSCWVLRPQSAHWRVAGWRGTY